MAHNPPLVSIITPSLNSRRYLRRLLACIDSQTYSSIEHIIVDGLSTDGSAAILEACDPAKHRVIFKKDRSMYQAINRGMALSHGEIIGYLNTDDLYFPTTIETVVHYFSRHPKVDIVFGDVVSVNEQRKSFVFYVYARRQYTLSRVALNKSIGQPSVFFRRGVLDTIGHFDDRLHFVADLEYWMRAAKYRLRFGKIPKFLSIDCRRQGMLRDRYPKALQDELVQVRKRYFSAPAWQRKLFERRNYWEDIFIDKLIEYNGANRFLVDRASKIIFDQMLYRLARKHLAKNHQPILRIKLPYFSFDGKEIEGLS